MNITELLKTESIYSSDDVVEKIQTYMQHNYQQNLTQNFIFLLSSFWIETTWVHFSNWKRTCSEPR